MSEPPAIVTYWLYVDGGMQQTPRGLGGAGWVLRAGPEDDAQILAEGMEELPEGTNIEIEWQALVIGLWVAAQRQLQSVVIRSDSEVVVRQFTGIYQVADKFHGYRTQAAGWAAQIPNLRVEYISRKHNRRADRLAKAAAKRKSMPSQEQPSLGLTVRFAPELADQIREAAEEAGISPTALLRQWCERWLDPPAEESQLEEQELPLA